MTGTNSWLFQEFNIQKRNQVNAWELTTVKETFFLWLNFSNFVFERELKKRIHNSIELTIIEQVTRGTWRSKCAVKGNA